jgi:predicted transcriptional regulator
MPPSNGISEAQEATLFAIWKLRGIGNSKITEEQLKAEVTNQPSEVLPETLTQLQTQGFVEISNESGAKDISITPLGLAILRKIQEDKLEEVK